MQSINKLEEIIKSIGYTFSERPIVLYELAHTLYASEIILSALRCTNESTVGILAATDLRVLYVGCRSLKDVVIKSIGYTEISSMEFQTKELSSSGTIEIKTKETFTINGCLTAEAENLIKLIHATSTEKKKKRDDLKDLGF